MSANTILLLQSVLIFLQGANAALASVDHISPVWCVLGASFVGAFQFYVQHIGNATEPPPKPQDQ